jgi:outer membrane protein
VYKKILYFLLFGILIIPCLTNAQLKIGYISSDQIMQQYPEAVEATKQLAVMDKEANDSLLAMQKEYQTKAAEYQQNKDLMQESSKKKTEQELQDLQSKYLEFRQKKTEEIQKKQETLLQPVLDKLQKTIEQVAKEEGLTFIFNKNQTGVLLYGDSEFNLTNKVLDLMIRGTKGNKKKGK